MKYYKKIGNKQYQILVNDLSKGAAQAMAKKHRSAGKYKSIRVVSIAGQWGICVR